MNLIETSLRKIIGDVVEGLTVPPDQIDPDTELSVYGVNSLHYIRLVVNIENEFGFQFTENIVDVEKNINQLVRYIEANIKDGN